MLPDKPPKHEENSEPLQDREEQQQGPDATHGWAPEERRVEDYLQREERPQVGHALVRGTVEWEPP